jgi:hypothetical protein
MYLQNPLAFEHLHKCVQQDLHRQRVLVCLLARQDGIVLTREHLGGSLSDGRVASLWSWLAALCLYHASQVARHTASAPGQTPLAGWR